MKKIYNYILVSVLAFASAGCVNEEFYPDQPSAESGDEVKFGLSLGDPKTRTVYGDETEGKNTFPIYWVDGDKVQIFSPQASEGRNNAEYKVALPSGVANPNYAEDLVKTGSYGVQWGEGYTYTDDKETHEGVHDCYSIYPSGKYTFAKDENGDIWAKGVEISSTQNISYLSTGLVHAMNNCLMYAYTPKVEMGQVANLNYKPLSTVLWFTLTADEQTNAQNPKGFQIFGITLTANSTSAIAGSFDINLTAEEAKDIKLDNLSGGNIIKTSISDKSTTDQQVAYTLPAGSTISFPIFLSPDAFDINGWKITIDTDQGSYTKTLATKETKLAAGQIHKIVLPKLAPGEKEWNVSQWMTYIPRNVYLSEISIPGTWNSLNPDFQTDLSISSQYSKGVRAFHLDTRWQREVVNISWSGIEYKYTLGVANGGSTQGGSTDKYDNDSPTFESCLNEVIANINNSEYMVVVCSFAQNSADASGTYGKWYEEISAICSSRDEVYDASKLTPNTLVGDVLGKVIVMVNMPAAITTSTLLPSNSKCLFTYMPSELSDTHFDTDYADNTDEIWLSDATTAKAIDSKISIFNSQAQITSNQETGLSTSNRGYAPTIDERTRVLDYILDWSKSNYDSELYAHNQWIYLGLGGYMVSTTNNPGAVSGSYVTIETEYNSWINDRVEAMGQNGAKYYPVGIVLMNNKNGETNYKDKTNAAGKQYNFAAVVKNILMLNNKYGLQYDPTKPEDYAPIDQPDEEENQGDVVG